MSKIRKWDSEKRKAIKVALQTYKGRQLERELVGLVDRAYTDGFNDGYSEGQDDVKTDRADELERVADEMESLVSDVRSAAEEMR